MANNNMGRLAEDMKREIIDIIGHMKDPRVQGFLTVMRVDAIKALNHAAGHVRSEIAKRMHIRKSPAFTFVRDEGAAYAARINKIIGELNHD